MIIFISFKYSKMIKKITKEELNKIIDDEEYVEIKINNFNDLYYLIEINNFNINSFKFYVKKELLELMDPLLFINYYKLIYNNIIIFIKIINEINGYFI